MSIKKQGVRDISQKLKDSDYADDLTLLANTPAKLKSLLYKL